MNTQEVETNTTLSVKRVSRSFFDGAITFTRTIRFEIDGVIIGTRLPLKVDEPQEANNSIPSLMTVARTRQILGSKVNNFTDNQLLNFIYRTDKTLGALFEIAAKKVEAKKKTK